MREEFRIILEGAFCNGITPAHAGRIDMQIVQEESLQDHPRACGKNRSGFDAKLSAIGSPPRMREEYHVQIYRAATDRITPAHAGRM